jgi:predicted dinucleotide-binding enzyme
MLGISLSNPELAHPEISGQLQTFLSESLSLLEPKVEQIMSSRGTVGVIGSGGVGVTLANGFIKHGYKAMIGTREPAKLADWEAKSEGNGRAGSVAETAPFGDIIVLATKGTAALEALKAAGKDNLKGKIVIDATNPIADKPPVNGVLEYFTGPNESLMEQLQKEFPETKFVKAFSCVGANLMVNPVLAGGPPTMFICGNDDSAKAEVTKILELFGWEAEDAGPVEAARAIEPLAILWCAGGFLKNDWVKAFKYIRPQKN